MRKSIRLLRFHRPKLFFICALLFVTSFTWVGHVYANDGKRLITVHDRGDKRVILTHATSVKDALRDGDIPVTKNDIVEPALDSQLVAQNYTVNIYRARPVIVVDGAVRQKVITAAQTEEHIVKASDVTPLRKEDKATFSVSSNIVADGASAVLTIDRAVPFTLQLYGKPIASYSRADTVREMIKQKGIKLAVNDTVSVSHDTPLKAGMTVSIWREGVQTATVDEPIAFKVRKIIDMDQPIGYHKVQAPGENGRKSVTYEITVHAGREVSRKAIQNVTLDEPKEQIEVVGAKPGPNALTKSKGAHIYTDSKGVPHRETYYDLPMNVVMGACGGGSYSVRADGAKIDKDGYILVAAHLGNYPRCSIVETSMGLGKVYDTGGFTAKHPHGFDLATDWTMADGR